MPPCSGVQKYLYTLLPHALRYFETKDPEQGVYLAIHLDL